MKILKNEFILISLTALLCQPLICDSSNILFYFGLSSYSHRISVWPLVEELAERGHNVTYLSPHVVKGSQAHPKVHEFNPRVLREELSTSFGHNISVIEERLHGRHSETWKRLPNFGLKACESMFKSPEVLNWVKRSTFDLVIIDALFNECALGFAYKFGAPFIFYSTSTLLVQYYDLLGIIPETASIPDLEMSYGNGREMSFIEQVKNTLTPLYWYFSRHFSMFPKMEEILKRGLELDYLPPMKELEKNASLILLNTHFSVDLSRALPPNVIPIGGILIPQKMNEKTADLQKSIVDFIGEDKFFCVSFGTYVEISTLSPEMLEGIFEGMKEFSEAGFKFIWKWEGKLPQNIPKNVLLIDWLPQQKLLAHKNIVGFITHAGFLSIQEATYYGVPLITVPLFAEQDYNANNVVRFGTGVRLDLNQMRNETLIVAIKEIIINPRYRKNMKTASELIKDQPMNPLDLAVYWTEFVLRHKGEMSRLKLLGANQSWYERRLLHVWLFVLFIIVGIVMALFYMAFFLLKTLFKILLYGENSASRLVRGKSKVKVNLKSVKTRPVFSQKEKLKMKKFL